MIKGKYKKWIFSTLLTASAIALLDALVFEKYFFKVNHIPIGNLNTEKVAIRLLLLSDLHLKKQLTSKHYKLAKKIHALVPDLILLTGDSLDEHGEVRVLDEFLSLLNMRIPKVAIAGNHDYKAKVSIEELGQVFAKFNGRLLVNESKAYQIKGEKLVITGLDDFIQGEGDLKKAVEQVGGEGHHIALIHSPLQQEKLRKELAVINAGRNEDEKVNISYIFAGHNHGGQVSFFGLFAPYLPRKSGDYLNGWYNKEKPYLYLSKGFGTSTIPFRFFARAEIALFYYYT